VARFGAMASHLALLLVLGLAGLRYLVDPLVAGVAALAAAASFAAGDPPRRPWLLRGVALALVFVAHSLQRAGLAGEPRLDYVLLIVANLLGVAAMVGFFRVVRSSGVAEPASRGERLLVAAALAGVGGLVVWLLTAIDGPWLRVATVGVSTLADATTFMVSLVLLRMVAPLRGGTVAQPYFMLVLDGLCYLLIDVARAQGDEGLSRAVAPLGAFAAAAGTAAGFCQAAVVRRR
jgi:hypothetical protein